MLSVLTIAAFLVIVPGMALAADTDKGSVESVKKEAQETLEAAKKFAEKQKQEYQQKIQKELDGLSGRIEQLKEKARSATGDALTRLNQGIADLEKKKGDAQRKLDDMKTAGAEAWTKLKSGLDNAVNELKNTFQGLTGEEKK